MEKYILALDQGTTSSRAILFDHQGRIQSVAQKEFTQIFPHPGWVEHDPNEIWSSQAAVATEAVVKAGADGRNIAAIGITNQRETTIVWDRETGEAIYNAIVWQDRRTAPFCEQLKQQGLTETIRSKTGLVIDAYFSGSKIRWLLDNISGAEKKKKSGGGKTGLRYRGLLAGLEIHPGAGPCHRHHQCRPHDVIQYPRTAMG